MTLGHRVKIGTGCVIKNSVKMCIRDRASGEDLLRRPEMTYEKLTTLTPFAPALTDEQAAEHVQNFSSGRRS